MIALLLLPLAGAVELSTLEQTEGWREVRTARTPHGEVRVRSTRIGEVVCAEGTALVSTSPADLAAVTDDLASAPGWSNTPLTRSEEIRREGASYSLYQYYNSPMWTLTSDRFWVIEGTTLQEGSTYTFTWQRAAVPSPQRDDALSSDAHAIEPPVNLGRWHFEPTGAGTQLTYGACADFGGSLPASIQQWVTTQQVPTVIEDLVTEASRRAGL